MSRTPQEGEVMVRRATIEDSTHFNSLVNTLGRVPVFRATFGMFNYTSIIEYSFLCLIAYRDDSKDNCCGFIAINDSTSCTADSDSYEKAIEELSEYLPLTVTNTLFLNFWAVEEKQKFLADAGISLVRKAFELCPDVDNIVWLCPVAARMNDYLDHMFMVVTTDFSHEDRVDSVLKGFRILVLTREKFLPKLLVRQARVEDNDDLLPILMRNNPLVANGQEDYFLANLIQSQDDRNRFYVGVDQDIPVGMLTSSWDVNVSLIKKVFDLDGFADLILKKTGKQFPPAIKIGIMGDSRLIHNTLLKDLAIKLQAVYIDGQSFLSGIEHRHFDTDAEDESAYQAIDMLHNTIVDTSNSYMGIHGEAPVACLITGFPRSEKEAEAVIDNLFTFDYILEVGRHENDNSYNFDEDASTLSLLEAIDVLHGHFTEETEVADDDSDSRPVGTVWRKISFDGNSTAPLLSELESIIENRRFELLAQGLDDTDATRANAFAVTVFCMDEAFESRAEDLLRVVFEDHPKLDYCVFMVPNNASIPSSLTAHMTCAKVKTGVSFNQSLYIMHKEVLLAKETLQVTRMKDDIVPLLGSFLDPLGRDREEILSAVNASMKENDVELKDNPGEACFAIMADQEVIGVVVLSRKVLATQDLDWLRASYELDTFVNYERHRMRSQAMVTQWILNPAFSRWAKFILREILRRYEKTLLYFHGPRDIAPASEIIDEFLPIRPRRRMQKISGDADDVHGNTRPSSTVATAESPLFLATKKHLSQPKITIGSRIVVVAGSPYAYSTLEMLCFVPHLNFANLYVVMERPPVPFLSAEADAMIKGDDSDSGKAKFGDSLSGCLSVRDVDDPLERDLYALGMSFRSTLVRGHLTDIDRGNRAIVVSDEVVVEYDVLIISSPSQDNTVTLFPATKGMHPATCNERGIFGLGNAYADEVALRWILRHANSHSNGVVVYGTGVDALAAVGNLLKFIGASRITLVMPEKDFHDVGHQAVHETILITLQNSGVNVYKGHVITDVNLSSHNFIQSVNLENRLFKSKKSGGMQSARDGDRDSGSEDEDDDRMDENDFVYNGPQFSTIHCSSLLCCVQKQCDTDVFAAINDSGLVYDGGVVVDETFRTVDPLIYAVGNYTKFSRVYRDAVRHTRYNARELGAFVGLQVLQRHLDPFSPSIEPRRFSVTSSAASSSAARFTLPAPVPGHKLPVFTLAKTILAVLPGGFTLLLSTLPTVPKETQELVTGDACGEKLTVLKLDQLGVVVEVVYIGTLPIEEKNLARIAGHHEAYLNSAVYSYENGLVDHWTDFFRQNWATAILHDRFADLVRDLRDAVQTDKGMLMILDKVFEIADSTEDDQVVADVRRKIVGDRGDQLEELTQKTIEAQTLEFVKRNKSVLTKFYVPQMNKQQSGK